MTQDELRILENYVRMGNVLTADQALALIESLKAKPVAAAPKEESGVSFLRQTMNEWVEDRGAEGVLFLGPSTGDEMDNAFLGLAEVRDAGKGLIPVAVYDLDLCIEALMAQGMDAEEAEEYFAFNTAGAYAGPQTPIFLQRFEE